MSLGDRTSAFSDAVITGLLGTGANKNIEIHFTVGEGRHAESVISNSKFIGIEYSIVSPFCSMKFLILNLNSIVLYWSRMGFRLCL